MQAVEGMDWSGYGGRIILLVTDAGALRKNDPFAATQMNEAEVRQAALGKQIKIYALHLRTDAGKKTHGGAESQYRILTADANPQIGDLYTPVPGGDVRKLGERVDEIGTVFANLVHQVRSNTPQPVPLLSAAPSLADKSAAIGYAMHMDFLGRKTASQAPQLVSAWTADRDLTNPALPAFQVCVMLTKLQLNDLQQSLKLIVDAARKTQTSPKDFVQEIASASAYMSRDPQALRKGGNLADGGLLGEYLEGLPYRSKSLNRKILSTNWTRRSASTKPSTTMWPIGSGSVMPSRVMRCTAYRCRRCRDDQSARSAQDAGRRCPALQPGGAAPEPGARRAVGGGRAERLRQEHLARPAGAGAGAGPGGFVCLRRFGGCAGYCRAVASGPARSPGGPAQPKARLCAADRRPAGVSRCAREYRLVASASEEEGGRRRPAARRATGNRRSTGQEAPGAFSRPASAGQLCPGPGPWPTAAVGR